MVVLGLLLLAAGAVAILAAVFSTSGTALVRVAVDVAGSRIQ